MTTRPIRAGDIIRIRGEHGHWRILYTRNVQGGTRITATSLNAYPRVDISTPASNASHAHQK